MHAMQARAKIKPARGVCLWNRIRESIRPANCSVYQRLRAFPYEHFVIRYGLPFP